MTTYLDTPRRYIVSTRRRDDSARNRKGKAGFGSRRVKARKTARAKVRMRGHRR